jgi:hypothetical protein
MLLQWHMQVVQPYAFHFLNTNTITPGLIYNQELHSARASSDTLIKQKLV